MSDDEFLMLVRTTVGRLDDVRREAGARWIESRDRRLTDGETDEDRRTLGLFVASVISLDRLSAVTTDENGVRQDAAG